MNSVGSGSAVAASACARARDRKEEKCEGMEGGGHKDGWLISARCPARLDSCEKRMLLLLLLLLAYMLACLALHGCQILPRERFTQEGKRT